MEHLIIGKLNTFSNDPIHLNDIEPVLIDGPFWKKDDVFLNFYVHITSNEDYLKYYYIDYGFGSVHYYNKNEYVVSSIEDVLLDQIKNKLFKNISSEFSNQDISVEMSFSDSEIDAFNKLNKKFSFLIKYCSMADCA